MVAVAITDGGNRIIRAVPAYLVWNILLAAIAEGAGGGVADSNALGNALIRRGNGNASYYINYGTEIRSILKVWKNYYLYYFAFQWLGFHKIQYY